MPWVKERAADITRFPLPIASFAASLARLIRTPLARSLHNPESQQQRRTIL
jgi:hypothetical protein